MRFLLGGYTAESDGNATGIGVLLAGGADDALAGGQLRFAGDAAATGGSPSWVAQHPSLDVAYAALEGAGTVRAYRRTGEASFAALGAPIEAGASVCHVAVAPDGGSLIASCWTDGRVVRMSLDAAGTPSKPLIAAPAVDPYGPEAAPAEFAGAVDLARGDRGRANGQVAVELSDAARALRAAAGEEYAHLIPEYDQPGAPEPADQQDPASRVSRSHEAVFLPGGLVATTDMGLDLVRFWRTSASGLRFTQQVVFPKGSGPRHMVWHPSGHLYVVAELSREAFVLAPDVSGAWRLIAGTPLGAGTLDDDTAAELAASRDGEYLYAGVRGSNTIATLKVRGAGETLSPVALVDSGVNWPRHHVVVRDTLLVAGQLSNEVASLTLDVRSGVPVAVRHRTEAPSPTCVLPLD